MMCSPMAIRRVVATLLIVLAAYLLTMAVVIATRMIRSLFEGGFLGLEPELLIPVGIGAIAAVLIILARRLVTHKLQR